MAKPNLFNRFKLVYRHSSLQLKILVLVTLVVSAAALVALRVCVGSYQQQSRVLQSQAAQLREENEALARQIAELGSKESIRRIATEELGMADPNSEFFSIGE